MGWTSTRSRQRHFLAFTFDVLKVVLFVAFVVALAFAGAHLLLSFDNTTMLVLMGVVLCLYVMNGGA